MFLSREADRAEYDGVGEERRVLRRCVNVINCSVECGRQRDDVSAAVGHAVDGAEEYSGPTCRGRDGDDAVIEEAVTDTPVRRVVAAEELQRLHARRNGAVDGEVTGITDTRVRGRARAVLTATIQARLRTQNADKCGEKQQDDQERRRARHNGSSKRKTTTTTTRLCSAVLCCAVLPCAAVCWIVCAAQVLFSAPVQSVT